MMNADVFIDIMNNYSNIALLISIFASVIIAVLGVVPSIFVTGANIIFFGPIKGFFISLIGETIGAGISFWLYRKGFKKKVENFSVNNKYLKKLVKSQGKESIYLVFLIRLLPFVPSGFVTLGASVSNMNIIPFTIATFLGKIPSIILEALVSYDFINIQDNWIRLIITLLALILIIMFMNKHYKSNEV
ncbi:MULTISPECIES: VTT domain-containing protein [unclassified Clostridium]|uniref:TVP38/TMEM64 family protein n=1 Tax=unclassified Clostridium TaxID=2614128 RepID=UPI0013EE7ACD|nr:MULTISPECIES: VTT domain-containing protein [unclassified Clostridium]MBZ9690967.1 VTT domain-containing protein [Clostridium sp. M14]